MDTWKRFYYSDWLPVSLLALFRLVMHLVAIQGFGYFRDELYYLDCSDHPGFGYVDQPPLSVLVLKLVRWILGDSRLAIRLLPAMGGALFILAAAWMAREMGGKKFSMFLAGAAAFATVGNFFIFHFFSMNFLDILFWQVLIIVLIRLLKGGNAKLWVLFGLIAGLGLQNKISVLFLGFGVAVGILLTPERKYLRSPYLWIGFLIAVILFSPYVIWNATHNWATLEFMHNARTYKMTAVGPLDFLKGQVLYNNPGTLPVWLAGLYFLIFRREGRRFRLFGWMFMAIYVLFTIQQAKDYYLAGAYPVLFAAAAVLWEKWYESKRIGRYAVSGFAATILLSGLFFCPNTLPVLSIERTEAYLKWLGIRGQAGERHEMGVLPQHFADMFGWEELAKKVADIYSTLSEEEKNDCVIYATNYGRTGAINFFGKKYGLPRAVSGHNSHYFWPPENFKGTVVIIIGGTLEDHADDFDQVTEAGRTQCRYCMPYENKQPIWIGRGLRIPLKDVWPTTRHFI